MSGVNKVILIGRLGKDPDVRTMQSGDKVVTFGLATSDTWRDKTTGERKERTEWHQIVIFNENLVKVAEQYLRKGHQVHIEGKLRTREYTDKDGNARKTTEVVLEAYRGELTLLEKSDRPAPSPSDYGTTTGRPGPSQPADKQPAPDDDIPF